MCLPWLHVCSGRVQVISHRDYDSSVVLNYTFLVITDLDAMQQQQQLPPPQ